MGAASHRFDVRVKRMNAHSVSVEFSTDNIILVSECMHDSIRECALFRDDLRDDVSYLMFTSLLVLQVSSRSEWFLHVHLGLSMAPLSQVTMVPLSLLPPSLPTTTTTTPTPSQSTQRESLVLEPIHAIIGVLVAVVFILVLCMGVAVGVACMVQGRAKFRVKTLKASNEKVLLNSVRGAKRSRQNPPTMKRTRSTIGFPTQEHRLKTTPRVGVVKRETHPVASLHRSQSLPSVFPLLVAGQCVTPLVFSRDPATTRRVNPSRGRIRIKKLNADTAELKSWTSERLKENKELANLQVVQELALKRKNYGVNEIHPSSLAMRSPHGKGGPYARYVVRSLAASAKTPEPGSSPITLL